MSSSHIDTLLHKSYEDVEKYGSIHGYSVYKVYSEPSRLIVPKSMKDDKNRLEVEMYVGIENSTHVSHIDRYEDGTLVEQVDIEYSIQSYLDSVFPNKSQQFSFMDMIRINSHSVYVLVGKGCSGKSLFLRFLTNLYPDRFDWFNGISSIKEFSKSFNSGKDCIVLVNSLDELTVLDRAEYWTNMRIIPFTGSFTAHPNLLLHIPLLAAQYKLVTRNIPNKTF